MVPRAFSDMVVTFRGRRKGNLVSGRKGSERFYFEVEISWHSTLAMVVIFDAL